MKTLESTSGLSFEERCHAFELEHHMSSNEFMRRFEAGELGDDAVYFDWHAAKCGLDVMRRNQHGTGDDS